MTDNMRNEEIPRITSKERNIKVLCDGVGFPAKMLQKELAV